MIPVSIHTLGCKLNQAESQAIAHTLGEAGYLVVEAQSQARVHIVNTCSVTHVADRKSRHLLRWLHRQDPQAFIIATGCYAQHHPQEASRLNGVGLVVPVVEKLHIPDAVRERLEPPVSGERCLPKLRTRALVKIQDGCDQFCSYCIVPLMRGREQSMPPDGIVAQVKERELEGYQEVVLTGTQVGSYRWNSTDLAQLLRLILSHTSIPRLRLTSLQPQHLTPALLALWDNPRLCPHFHLPLQSGSDAILLAMGRGYSAQVFSQAVAEIRRAIPDVAITTDVIVGFPGEQERDFQETVNLCREIGFARLHIFPFSRREGTRAALLPPVAERDKQERTGRMLSQARESARRYQEAFFGRTLPVLWEQQVCPGLWSGLTPNYMRIFARSRQPLAGRVTPVTLREVFPEGLRGEVTDLYQGG